ncbi:MAG: hypothetical protein GY796_02940 [Chloroflexi bacterium]|nr:hypothetical protein [Chloroflexota bacterium]
MKIIPLTPDDDIVSICDHLDWAFDQQVIFVLPQDGGVLCEGLDLVRLRRYADNVRVEVALVTAVNDITQQANGLGIPTFITIGAARRGRGRKRREVVGISTVGDERFADWENIPRLDVADQQEAHHRLEPRTERRLWLWRYMSIFLFFVTLALMIVAFLYLVPAATVTLKPETLPVFVEQSLNADPAAAEADFQNGILPGRQLETTQSWQANVVTTGSIEVPETSARGTVVFANLLDQEVVIPAGTRVRTSDGSNRIYQTTADITVAGVGGSTAEAEVIAIEPGPQGNVAANLVNTVEGSQAVQVEVRNLEPIAGGDVRQAAAVTEEDRSRLRAQAVQFLLAVAASEMESQLSPHEFLTRDSLRILNLLDETYSHEVGEQTSRLTLSMRAEIAGTAVNSTAASDLAYAALGQQIQPGYTLVPDSIRFESGNITGVDEAGQVHFSMIASGSLARNLPVNEAMAAITGQKRETAAAYLNQQLPLRAPPEINIWPVWFDRIPYLSTRINTEIETGE